VTKKITFSFILVAAIAAATLGCLEFVASFYAPPWPIYLLRASATVPGRQKVLPGMATSADEVPFFNSWGERDRERSLARPPGEKFRAVLVGDSLLEGSFIKKPLSQYIEEDWERGGLAQMEAINLGIAATSPIQYYYRTERLALGLNPDVVLLTFGSGNDFVDEAFGAHIFPPFIAELPEPSILGWVAPKLTWVLIDRLHLSELNANIKKIPDDLALLNDAVDKPPGERMEILVGHMKKYYFPGLSEATIREILSRGDEKFWNAFSSKSSNRQFLMGWMLYGLIDWETGAWPVPKDSMDADRMLDMDKIEKTLSWLTATRQLVEKSGAKFVVGLAPTGIVDPDFVTFWEPWPRLRSFSVTQDARHRMLATLLERDGFNVVDLRKDLIGVRGTYRVADQHWNEKGHEIVAERLAKELLKYVH
jgi:hypothetical protein